MLAEAEAGNEIVITRRGTPVARLVPAKRQRTDKARAAEIGRFLDRISRPLGGLRFVRNELYECDWTVCARHEHARRYRRCGCRRVGEPKGSLPFARHRSHKSLSPLAESGAALTLPGPLAMVRALPDADRRSSRRSASVVLAVDLGR
ncbi:MAG: type II toxin-antitoxin system Phd/YefM family antitoxin [Alphaproteobacteria bacterium]